MRTRSLAAFLLLTAMAVAPGCATDTDEPDRPGPSNPVRPDDPTPVQPLKAEGTYVIDSAFNLEGSLAQEGVGGSLKEVVELFDEPTDPVHALLDTIADAVGSADGSKLRKFFQKIELAAVTGLQTRFPEQWTKVTNFGKSVVNMVRRFGVRARLELATSASSGTVTAKLTVYALTLRIEGETDVREIKFSEAGLADIVVENVPVTVSADGTVAIGEHSFGVTFGDMADLAIQEVLIPALDPTLADEPGDRLAPFLKKLVKCTSADGRTLGTLVVEQLGEEFDWAGGIIDTACSTGVTYVVTYLNTKLAEKTEGALMFKVSGTAHLGDDNNDRIADKLTQGTWSGEVTIAGTAAPLMGDQQFLGRR